MRKRIISDPEILSGTPVFEGTRIPLEHIMGLLRKGISAAEIAEDHPALSRQDIAFARARLRLSKSRGSAGRPAIQPIQLRRKSRAA